MSISNNVNSVCMHCAQIIYIVHFLVFLCHRKLHWQPLNFQSTYCRLINVYRKDMKKISQRHYIAPLRGSSSPFSTLSLRGLNPIKPVYDPDRPDDRHNLTASAFNQLGQYTAVLVTGVTATQNSRFSSLSVAVTIDSTHCAYPWRDGQAELAWLAGYVVRQFTCPKAVTYPSTNRAQCRATALIESNALPLYTKPPPRLAAVH